MGRAYQGKLQRECRQNCLSRWKRLDCFCHGVNVHVFRYSVGAQVSRHDVGANTSRRRFTSITPPRTYIYISTNVCIVLMMCHHHHCHQLPPITTHTPVEFTFPPVVVRLFLRKQVTSRHRACQTCRQVNRRGRLC